MRHSFFIAACAISLTACSSLSGEKKPEKADDKTAVTEVKHVDLSCAPSSSQGSTQYSAVNRISIDLINNRIDLFSKEQIWQFHGINDAKATEIRDIKIAYVGRNVAAWGMKTGTPYSFFYDTAKATVTLAYISAGTPMSVIFQCS
ncbi:MAG: hypothetical protein ACKOXK_07765 [Chakrabartia sp.]